MTIQEFLLINNPQNVEIRCRDYRSAKPISLDRFWEEYGGTDIVKEYPKTATLKEYNGETMLSFTL